MKRIFSVITLLLFVFVGAAQSQQLTINKNDSQLTVFGTSNIHDWEIIAESMSGSLTPIWVDNKLKSLEKLTFKIPVESLKSGKSGMDKNTYVALKSDKYPNIKFNLQSTKITGNDITVTGTLEIAGTKKTVTFPVKYSVSGGNIVISGSYKMKMTDYKVEPPTALFGSITTGNDLTIKFNIQFKK